MNKSGNSRVSAGWMEGGNVKCTKLDNSRHDNDGDDDDDRHLYNLKSPGLKKMGCFMNRITVEHPHEHDDDHHEKRGDDSRRGR